MKMGMRKHQPVGVVPSIETTGEPGTFMYIN